MKWILLLIILYIIPIIIIKYCNKYLYKIDGYYFIDDSFFMLYFVYMPVINYTMVIIIVATVIFTFIDNLKINKTKVGICLINIKNKLHRWVS